VPSRDAELSARRAVARGEDNAPARGALPVHGAHEPGRDPPRKASRAPGALLIPSGGLEAKA